MGSLIAGVLDAVRLPPGLAGDGTPYVPSAPVRLGGTSGIHRHVSEVGSWQVLVLMFIALIVLGASVLMFAVWQRTRVLARRRVRRMALATLRNHPAPGRATPHPHPRHGRTAPHHAPRHTRRAEPAGPERVT